MMMMGGREREAESIGIFLRLIVFIKHIRVEEIAMQFIGLL